MATEENESSAIFTGWLDAPEHISKIRALQETIDAQQSEIKRLTREAVKYEIGEGSHKIYVEKRSEALWCITRDGSSVLNTDGEWEYEPMPSGRDGDFIARTRYLRNTALSIARAQAKPTQ